MSALIVRTDHYPLPLPDGHRFPAQKYPLLYQAVAGFALHRCCDTQLVSAAELGLAHDADYVARVLDGRLSAAEERVIGLPYSDGLRARVLATTGATLLAGRIALQQGLGVSLAGGTHHAYAARGGGFCVFNDSAVCLRVLQHEGLLQRALVIDLDVHQGNGTAHMLADAPELFTFSMHGRLNFPFTKERSDWDIELDDGCDDARYLDLLAGALPQLFALARPDLVLYLAGADSYAGDRLGRLGLSQAGLAARDAQVFAACRRFGVPLVLTMAGGYASPIEHTVAIQTETVRLALATLA